MEKITNNQKALKWNLIPGLVDYKECLKLMELTLDEVISLKSPDTILLVEHKPVITVGTGVLSSENQPININNTPVIKTGRGGKFTFHGEGQRVIYPIVNLNTDFWNRDIRKFITFLNIVTINTLNQFSIKAFTHDEHIGIWTQFNNKPAKIAAIGIRVRKWVTFHGIAINLSTNLSNYNNFIPCGITDLGVTSAQQLGINISFEEFDEAFKFFWIKEYQKL